MQKELIEYIENMLQQGHSPERIKEAITQAGYTEEQATEALQYTTRAQTIQKKVNKAWMIMIVCVLLAVILTATYLLWPVEKAKTTELPEQYYIPQAPVQQQPEEIDLPPPPPVPGT